MLVAVPVKYAFDGPAATEPRPPLQAVLDKLAQSLAREFQPRGIHVAHFVIDGAIRNPGRLGPDFDFARGQGLGTGLGLVRSLLPQKGMTLRLANADDGHVETRIELTARLRAAKRWRAPSSVIRST